MDMARAMSRNPHVKVLILNGYYDIATPFYGVEYTINHLGLKKEIKDNIITLKGERVIDNEVKEENYYRKERSFGTFQRAFTLPDAVSSDKVRANFKDGVLKIEIPKPEEKKPKQITVNVE